jgi:nicotinate phosphoribosyltransferase
MEYSPAPPLLIDLYELTMAQAYLDAGIADRRAVFELSFRRPPHGGTFAVAAGIGLALELIEGLRLRLDDMTYIRSLGIFGGNLLDRLAEFRFQGDVEAVREGTVVFPREPILRVSGSILEAQILETHLLNLIGFSTLAATKAARIAEAAAPAEVVEFGCRRAQGPDGAVIATRASFIGGAFSTSNLEAGKRFRIPVKGTMAHSFVMAFPSEAEAFRAFARSFPGMAVLLIDTDDTVESGLPAAIAIAREMRARGERLAGVRIDSGDLAAIAREVRSALDAAGFPQVKIFASGDLDERGIAALAAAGAPIDAYGVGTRLASSDGDSALTCIYKLVAVEEAGGRLRSRMKRTDEPGKATLPGAKQVYRKIHASGSAAGDTIALDEEGDRPEGWAREARGEVTDVRAPAWIPLLEPALRSGRRIAPPEDLGSARDRARGSLASIPLPHRRLDDPEPYPVTLSPGLERLARELGSPGR